MSNQEPRGDRGKIVLEPGSLWTRVKEQTQHALSSGALQPLQTEYEFVEQDGISFFVRTLSSLARKDKAHDRAQTASKEKNPFLPYEEDLFVSDISDTHLCLLNKYNAVDYHLLVVTREFEEQETWLTKQDFEAMWAVLAEIDGLFFYNAGKTAGASQRHKHLQLVPFPLVPNGPNLPIELAIASAQFQAGVGSSPKFPFVHAIAPLNQTVNSPTSAAQSTLERYYDLLRAVGTLDSVRPSGTAQTGAYNLLATREWMLLVPRTQERFESISVNSLGFAGALLVRNPQQMKLLKEQQPLAVLKSVAVAS